MRYVPSGNAVRNKSGKTVEDVRISIGIGILKKMFYIVAIDLYGKVIAKDTIDLDYSDTEEYYEKVANKIDEFIEEYKYQKERILGVSIATQGIISRGSSVNAY